MKIRFSSEILASSKDALERLFYFNPRQDSVRAGIVNSLEKFGHPRLATVEGGLKILVGEHEAQTLFAFDTDRDATEPVGVAVFLRVSEEEMALIHLAVHPDYALKRDGTTFGLGVELVEAVRGICARVAGMKRLVLFYRREVGLRC